MFLHKPSLIRSLRLPAVTLAAAIVTAVAGCSSIPYFGNDKDPVDESSSNYARQSSTATTSGAKLVRINQPVPLAEGHPNEYVVQVGDTLWDIAAAFLKDPWFWPEIWYINPEIENPHLIYPGDVLGLVYIAGEQRVTTVDRGPLAQFRMSPAARVTQLTQAVSSIPYETVSAFLTSGVVLEKGQAKRLPYLVDTRGDHLMAAAGNEVYVRGLKGAELGSRYNVIHVGDPLIDPDDNRLVGYQGIWVGEGTMRRGGDPATVWLTDTTQEVKIGDRLMPESVDIPLNFFPKAPARKIDGRIISVVNGVSQIGQHMVVVVNRGARDGLAVGDVLTVFQTGQKVPDRIKGGSVRLPDEAAGTIMIFKVYRGIGYALVMEATQAIHIHDTIRNPI